LRWVLQGAAVDCTHSVADPCVLNRSPRTIDCHFQERDGSRIIRSVPRQGEQVIWARGRTGSLPISRQLRRESGPRCTTGERGDVGRHCEDPEDKEPFMGSWNFEFGSRRLSVVEPISDLGFRNSCGRRSPWSKRRQHRPCERRSHHTPRPVHGRRSPAWRPVREQIGVKCFQQPRRRRSSEDRHLIHAVEASRCTRNRTETCKGPTWSTSLLVVDPAVRPNRRRLCGG
jgi:hypothetical protein